MTGPLKGPGKFWNIDPIWGYILLILATSCAFSFSLYFQFDQTFLIPLPLLRKTFWSPLLVTQNFFGPPPFCPAPPPKYLWTLPYNERNNMTCITTRLKHFEFSSAWGGSQCPQGGLCVLFLWYPSNCRVGTPWGIFLHRGDKNNQWSHAMSCLLPG